MNPILCWLESVGLVTLVALSYLGLALGAFATIVLIVTGSEYTYKSVAVYYPIKRPLQFLGKALAVIICGTLLAALLFTTKNEVCRAGFWPTYKSAFHEEKK